MFVEPLRDTLQNDYEYFDGTPAEATRRLYRPTETAENDKELASDGGYSASEEEGNVSEKQILTRNRKRTKSKNGSLGVSNGIHKSAYV